MAIPDPFSFLQDLVWEDIPADVQDFARLLLLDLLGVGLAGTGTDLHKIVQRYASRNLRGACSVLFCDASLSPEGAALLGAMTIDAIDAHDGHRLTKGHVGCAVLPALLAAVSDCEVPLSGHHFLTLLVAGYEIGSRAGMALHQTACDYHTSGAWNAITAAALSAHVMGLSETAFAHAIGIAEYHGPRSQMMRVIDHPTMLKDGSGWGSMAGVAAAYLAAEGFTGAPAVSVMEDEVQSHWSTLGQDWETMHQYLKAFPVCRWAQPAVQAALDLQKRYNFAASDIAGVQVKTFSEGTRLWTGIPETTEQAQYAIGFPVAAALVRGEVGLPEISEQAFADPELRAVLDATRFEATAEYDAKFPAERWADISVKLQSGTVLSGGPTTAKGDPETQLTREEIIVKFHHLGRAVCAADHLKEIEAAVFALDGTTVSFQRLCDLIFRAPCRV
ncbi:2-methylcitrate dehydratase PrpD [Epibacterium ulvae]|uniref:2-methylcitrate dehydratase PrpD n=1 Tax=Epibacterium ulvae TaxID=1156985 RepID=A0A1G5QFK7_9RHOB|nr:MmgE/PrpD family protein [Epibacterium ulvae]SCZ60655.1 2-methylcitrate dehydratase PrpD [Epibacterium ulvae]